MKTAKVLAEMGLPDKYMFVSGLREKVASMLVSMARDLGEDRFRELSARLVEAVLSDAKAA